MYRLYMPRCGTFYVLLLVSLCGCSQKPTDHALDPALARTSVQKAMQAWVDGKKPEDLKPVIVGDPAWKQGRKLASFEILSKEETSDGSNLHVQVVRKFSDVGKGNDTGAESQVTYIVGTSPVVTIFPQ